MLKAIIRKLKYILCLFIPRGMIIFLLRKRKGVHILMYHSVRDENENQFAYIVNKNEFKIHLAALSEIGTCISLPAAVELIHKGSSGKCKFVISFDDGFADNIDIAAACLQKYSFPFTIFITRSFVESSLNTFLHNQHFDSIKRQKNITIGAHSLLHINHNFLSPMEIKKDFRESKAFLSIKFDRNIAYYAYTGGGYSNKSLEYALEYYEAAFKDRMDGKTDSDTRRIGRIYIPNGLISKKRFLSFLLSQQYIRLK